MKVESFKCERCEKEVEELYNHEGFCQTYFVEFVCKECYVELTGKLYSDC